MASQTGKISAHLFRMGLNSPLRPPLLRITTAPYSTAKAGQDLVSCCHAAPVRAVDAEGEVLDVLVQAKRNRRAALKLMRKLLKKYGFVPDKLVTDDLKSYTAAIRDLRISNRHETGRWRNNRAENSHQPTRRRERKMQGFKSPGSTSNAISPHEKRTEPSGHRRCRRGAKSSLRRERDVPADSSRALFGNVTEPR
jgi:hypothetical protein